jgi:hypothetical protein
MRRYVIMFKHIDSSCDGHEKHEIVKAENVELALAYVRKKYGYCTILRNIYSEEI